MYLTHTEIIVNPGMPQELEEAARLLGEAKKNFGGFRSQLLLNALGAPSKYRITSYWDNPDPFLDFMRSEYFKKYIEAHPSGTVFTLLRPTEAYESVFEVVGDDKRPNGDYEELIEWLPDRGKATAWERSRKDIFELRKLQEGFVSSRVFRYQGNSYKYLVIHTYADREAALKSQSLPQVQEYVRAHEHTDFTSSTPMHEAFRVVQRIPR